MYRSVVKNIGYRFTCWAVLFGLAGFFINTPAYAVDYTVPGTHADLQSAIYSAAADGANSNITITAAGVYNGPFVVPYTASERSYELNIIGTSSLSRDQIILDNPTAGIARGIPIPAVIAAEFDVIGTMQVTGMPMKLSHLTITASEILQNGGMEGTYSAGLAPDWAKSGAISVSEVTYDTMAALEVLDGDQAQAFTNSDINNYIYTVIPGASLGTERTYTFSIWFRRTGGAGNVIAQLIGAATASLSTSIVNYPDMYNQLTYTFTTPAIAADLTIKLYCSDTATSAVADGAAIASPLTAGVFFKGPAAANSLQGVSDCVVRNIGHISKKAGNAYQPASWADLDDPMIGYGDDVHGNAIVAFSGSTPLITDNDIRYNYDGVSIADNTLGSSGVQGDNPRLWSTDYADYTYWQMGQRIRYNARFGVAVRNGATPYIGMRDGGGAWPLDYANDISANGFANIAMQDDSAPRIYYNFIQGNFDYLYDLYYAGERNPSGRGIIGRENSAAIIVGNWIFDHNKAGVAVRDNATPQVGYAASWLTDPTDVRVNNIYGNNYYSVLDVSDPDYIACTHGAFDNIDCAAVGSMDGAQADVYNNYINYNYFAGVGSRDWAAPDVRSNWLEGNVLGMSFMSVRDSSTVAARIGGSAAGEGNEMYYNEIGIAIRNSGNRVNRVLIEGNQIYENVDTGRGVGIAVNNSYVNITDNTISSNAYADLPSGRKSAIALFNSSDAKITYNRILNNLGVGISAQDSVVEIENNLIADNFSGTYGYGVMLGGVDGDDYIGYLFNGGFEDEQLGSETCCYSVAPEWKMAGSIWATENTADTLVGSSSQEFGVGGANSSYLYYPAMVAAGYQYHFSGFLYKTAGTGTLYVQLSEPAYNSVYTTLSVSGAGWTQISHTFQAVSDDLYVKIYATGAGTKGVADDFELIKTKPGSLVKKFNHNLMVGDAWYFGRYDTNLVYIEGNTNVRELKHNILGRCRLGVLVEPGQSEHTGSLPVQGALAANEIKLAAGASSVDDAYVGMVLVIDASSSAIPKEAVVTAYNGTTQVAAIEYPVWVTAPAAGETYTLYSRRGRPDPGSIDYNLVYAWAAGADTDGVSDGYMLNGLLPGENTYYYGEYYGSPVAAFFKDSNHENALVQDYHVQEDAPIYSYTYRNGAYDCNGTHLGPDCNFTYPPVDYPYYWPTDTPFPAAPAADSAAPQLISINPADGYATASANTRITIYLQDQGTGTANSGFSAGGITRSSLQVQINSPTYSAVYTYGDPELSILPDYNNASQYNVLFTPSGSLGIGTVNVGISVADVQGNIYSTGTPYSFTTVSGDAAAPQIVDFFPKAENSCITSHLQPADIPIQFDLVDTASGVDIESGSLTVQTWTAGGALPQSLYNGSIYSYTVTKNTPLYSSYTVFYRPDCDYDNSVVVSATVAAYDQENNILSTRRKFCIAADTTPPEDVAYFKAKVVAQAVVSLTWDASVDSPLYDGSRPDPCDTGDLSHYELWVCGADITDSLICTFGDWQLWRTGISNVAVSLDLYDLPEGKYKFRLRGVDNAGNKSIGALSNKNVFYPYGEPVTLYTGYFDDNYDGMSDDFSGMYLSNWLHLGDGAFNISASKLAVSSSDAELLAHDFSAGNFEYTADLTLGAGEAGYLLMRKLEDSEVGSTGYAAFVDLANSRIGIYHLGDAAVVAQTAITPNTGTYNMKVTAVGNQISLTVTGAASGSTSYNTATTYSFGQVGIWQPDTGSGLTVSVVEFDDIVIKDYTDRWSSTGSWNTTGTVGGSYSMQPLSDNQDIQVTDLALPDSFILQADVTIGAEGSEGCLMFNKENEGSVVTSGYMACIETTVTSDYVRIYRKDGNLATPIATTTSQTIDTGTTYHLKLMVSGSTIALYGSSTAVKPYDYDRWAVASDSTYSNGAAGFWQQTGKGADVTYDNLTFGETSAFRIPDSSLGNQYIVTYYAGNPTQQYNTIQSKINNASYGDYLYFAGCNPSQVIYDIGDNIIQLKRGVSLLGDGPSCTMIRGSGLAVITASNESTIEGIRISGTNKKPVGIYCGNTSPMLIDNEIVSCHDGIRIGGVDGTQPTITGCAIYGNGRMGIGNNVFSAAWIFDNKIWGNALLGIGSRDNAHPRIEDNLIGSAGAASQPWQQGNGYVGIGNRGSSFAKVVRNRIKQNYGLGIGSRADSAPTIERNIVNDNSVHGIGSYKNSTPTIISNRVYNNSRIGIGSHDDVQAVISYNTVYSNLDRIGIATLEQAVVTINNNIVYNNKGIGIGFGDGSPAFTGTATVYGNQIFANGDSPNDSGGIGAQGLTGNASITIKNNRIYSQYYQNAIGFLNLNPSGNDQANITIQNNIIDNSTVTSNGDFGIEVYGGYGYTVSITGNTIRNFGRSGMRLMNLSTASAVTVQNNNITSCGAKDYVYAYNANMTWTNSVIYSCPDTDGCPAAMGVQLTDSHLSTSSVTGNTIAYNTYSGIGMRNTDGFINASNQVYENGNLYTVPGTGGGDICPRCDPLGAGASSGDGGVTVTALPGGEELRIYENGNEIYNNNVGDIRIKPGTLGTVYLNDSQVPGGSSGGQLNGYGVVYDCFDSADASPGGECNTTVTGMTFSGNDRYGILVRGPYSQNLIIENNIIQSNMTVSNSNNIICAGTANEDHVGGGIALTCGARPVIRDNIIRNNGADLRSEGKGSHSGINMWQAGDTQIYSNEIYGNANDGIDLRDTPIVTTDPKYVGVGPPQIGVAGQTANKIRNNARFGIGATDASSLEAGYNELYENQSGGIGFYQLTGTANIYSNSIYSNTGSSLSEVGGIGMKYLSGTVNIRNNIIRHNVYTNSYDYPAGIGVYRPTGGSLTIEGNTITSNQAHSYSDAGGIGLKGLSSASKGTLSNVYITSNRISHHKYGTGNQAAVSFKWLDLSSGNITIRNNKKDGMGLYDNATGVRFKELTNANVTINDNLIQSNINPSGEGASAVGFRGYSSGSPMTGVKVDINNNIMSNNRFTYTAYDKASVTFKYCKLYSSDYIKVRGNRINNTGNNGIEFRYVGGVTGHVAHVYIGTDAEAPGASNDILNIPASHNGIRFEDCTYGDGVQMNILNNNNVEGGIVFRDTKLTGLYIKGNANIYDGHTPGGMGGMMGVCECGMGMPDWDNNGIQGKVNTYAYGSGGVIPIEINNNGIRNNGKLGVFLPIKNDVGTVALNVEGNTFEHNGWAGFFSPSGSSACLDSFIFSGNTIYDNGLIGGNSPGYDSDGVVMRCLSASVGAKFTNNIIHSNKVNGLSLRDCDGVTVSGGKFYSNGIRGIGSRNFSNFTVEGGAWIYSNGKLAGSEDDWCGVGFDDATVTVRDSFVYGNYGAGIALRDVVNGTIVSNQIYDNRKTGIKFLRSNSTLTIRNNTIVSNGQDDYIDNSGLRDASGLRAKDSTFANITDNIFRNNKFSGIASYNTDGYIGPNNEIRYNGDTAKGGGDCGGLQGPGSGDGGVAVRNLGTYDTLIVSGNTVESNYLGSVSRKDCKGTVRLDGQGVDCAPYWDRADAKVYVGPDGVYVNNSFRSSSFTVDCTDPLYNDLAGGITGGKVWGVAIVGGIKNVIFRNCTVNNNMTTDNNLGDQGISVGGGVLVGPGVEAEVYNNTIYNNGFEIAQGSGALAVDGSYTTEWMTPTDDTVEPHWIKFDTGTSSQTITKVQIYAAAGSVARSWDVYVHNSTNWNNIGNVLDTFTAGGSGAGWYESATFSGSGRYITLKSSGGSVSDGDFAEFQYYNGASYVTPDFHQVCASLLGGNSGVTLRCVGNVNIHDNNIYSNWNQGIEGRNVIGTIGPNNLVHDHTKANRVIGFRNYINATIYSNEVYNNNYGGIGVNSIIGTVIIDKNYVHDGGNNIFPGIGMSNNDGTAVFIARNNTVEGHKQSFEAQKSEGAYPLDIQIYSNTADVEPNGAGWNGVRFRQLKGASISVRNNVLTGGASSSRFGIMFQDNGWYSTSEHTDITIYSNTILNFKRTGIRTQDNVNTTITISKNNITGNGGGAPNDNTRDGIHFRYNINSDINVTNNNVSSNVKRGIRFHDNAGIDVVIASNTIRNNTYQGLEFGDNYLSTTAGATATVAVRNNYIERNDYTGIQFKDNYDLDDILLYSNYIFSNSPVDNWGGVWLHHSDNVRLEKNYIVSNSGIGLRIQDCSPVIGAADYVFTISDPACWSGQTKNYMVDIYNHSQPYDWTPCSGRYWLRDKMETESVAKGGNVIRQNSSWGVQTRGEQNGRAAQVYDNDTSTDWSTSTLNDSHVGSHWIYFDLGSSKAITKVRVYARYNETTWDVYISNSTSAWGAKVTTFTTGGELIPGWDETNASGTGQYIKLESTGGIDGKIKADIFEFEYDAGSGWADPIGGATCSKLSDDNDGIAASTRDGNTSTQWRTHPGDITEPHWINYDLGDYDNPVSKLRIFTGTSDTRTWKVYLSDRKYETLRSPPADDLLYSGWVVGGSGAYETSIVFSYQNITPTNGAAYWKFDDGAGSSAADSIGANTGTLVNTPVWTSSSAFWKPGQYSLALNGATQLVEVADSTDVDFGPSVNFTIEAWIKVNSGGSGIILKKNGAGWSPDPGGEEKAYYSLYTTTNKTVVFDIRDNTNYKYQTLTSINSIKPGRWHHIVVVRDIANSQLKMYVNGVHMVSRSLTESGDISNGNRLIIGAGEADGSASYENYFDGQVD